MEYESLLSGVSFLYTLADERIRQIVCSENTSQVREEMNRRHKSEAGDLKWKQVKKIEHFIVYYIISDNINQSSIIFLIYAHGASCTPPEGK